MVKNFTYKVGKSYASLNERSYLKTLFERVWREEKFSSSYPHVCQMSYKQLEDERNLFGFYLKIKFDLEKVSGLRNVGLDKVWFVHSKASDTDKTKLPYVPHFDRKRFLKAIVYLHDVTLPNGPIHFAENSNPLEIEERRKNLPDDYKRLTLNKFTKDDLISCYRPVTGNAGDVVFLIQTHHILLV